MQRLTKAGTYGLLGAWAVICLFPLYWVAVNSMKSGDDIMGGPYYLPFVDFVPSAEAWLFILGDPSENLVRRFINTGVVAFSSTLLCLLLGAMAAYGLARFRPPVLPAQAWMTAILATRILPPAVLALPLYMMAFYTRTLDTRLALVVTYTAVNLPVAVWLLRPVFGLRATSAEEAAWLDGASQLRIFWEIAVPMAIGGLVGAGLLIFVLCWNEYLFAAYLAGDQAMTVPPWMVGQLSIKEAAVGGDAQEWSQLSAATVLMTAPLLLFTSVVQRVFSRLSVLQR